MSLLSYLIWLGEDIRVYEIAIKNGKIISGAGNPWYPGEIGIKEGRITKIKGISDDWETFFTLLIDNKLVVGITIESMGEEDVRRIMTGRYQMVGTDGAGIPASFSFGAYHPRFFGTYPRILAKYVREEKILTLEDTIRKMTSFPANKLGLQDRGLILEGNWRISSYLIH
ncbi:MAG: hypothetical protein ACTSV5_02370 [Promethearchaeota archaeon]